MNIFNIPSWYPSENNPIYGTFIKEQIEMVARTNPDWKMVVSTWGQGDPDHMIWVKDHFKNLTKTRTERNFESRRHNNLYYYQTLKLTWTRKLTKGNLDALIGANRFHLEKFQKDIDKVNFIHAQATYPAAFIANELSGQSGIPYFVTIRMSPFPFPEFQKRNGDLKSEIRHVLTKANGLIAPSQSLKKRLEEFGFNHVTVIPNPVDTEFFRPGVKSESADLESEIRWNESSQLNTPPLPPSRGEFRSSSPVIFTVGRMVPQKGIDLLIRAIARLGDRFPGKFRIAGDGDHLAEYKKLAQDMRVSSRIEWLGELSREQVRDEMQRCSFYVLPSRHETFGNVLLEAMACGKPIIATRCGGPEDIVNSSVGRLVDITPEAVAEAVDSFDPTTYSSEQIRNHTTENYSAELFSRRLEALFQGH